MTFIGWGRVGRGRKSNHFHEPIPKFKIKPVYYWVLQLYSHTWHIKTKLDTRVSKTYFPASSDKGASQFIMNDKKKMQVKLLSRSAEIKSMDGLK